MLPKLPRKYFASLNNRIRNEPHALLLDSLIFHSADFLTKFCFWFATVDIPLTSFVHFMISTYGLKSRLQVFHQTFAVICTATYLKYKNMYVSRDTDSEQLVKLEK